MLNIIYIKKKKFQILLFVILLGKEEIYILSEKNYQIHLFSNQSNFKKS